MSVTISPTTLKQARDIQVIRTYKQVGDSMVVDGVFLYAGEGLPLCHVDIKDIKIVEQ